MKCKKMDLPRRRRRRRRRCILYIIYIENKEKMTMLIK